MWDRRKSVLVVLGLVVLGYLPSLLLTLWPLTKSGARSWPWLGIGFIWVLVELIWTWLWILLRCRDYAGIPRRRRRLGETFLALGVALPMPLVWLVQRFGVKLNLLIALALTAAGCRLARLLLGFGVLEAIRPRSR
jgi:hypothetical protein